MEAGDEAVQILNEKGTVNVNGLQVTLTELRQMSLDASRAEVLPAARVVASKAAIETIDSRIEVLTERVIERINERDPGLFARWDDPRFLAALTSAQRSFAETGDEDLADTLSSLVVELAAQPIRSRREIILRQAITVAPQLTTEHINALVINLYLSHFKIGQPYSTDQLIRAFNSLFEPLYDRLPTSQLDYLYMSSTGVCHRSELGAFASTPYQVIYERYPNSMYPAFTYADLRENLLSDDYEHREAVGDLLLIFVGRAGDIILKADGSTSVTREGARFRVHEKSISRVLARERDVASLKLTPAELALREKVLDRTISLDEFTTKVSAIAPELDACLDQLRRTSALTHSLQPVGLVLARQVVSATAPKLAAVVDDALEKG